tara:strand:+ start:117 stop:371 length:255 start_codon:yes stop_codon:yes gene_type:complete
MSMRKCKISCRTFQGFEVNLDINYVETIDDICKQVKSTLVTHLETYNFENLLSIAKNIEFHIHDYEMGDILLMENNSTLWICNH